MNESPELTLLAIFCIPEIIGGIFMGRALRSLRGGISVNGILQFFWGGLIGFMPLVFGADEYTRMGMPTLLLGQIGVWVGAIGVAAVLPTGFLEELRSKNVSMIAIGGLFLLIGLGVGAVVLRNGDRVGWIIILLAGVAGGTVLMLGLRGLWREK